MKSWGFSVHAWFDLNRIAAEEEKCFSRLAKKKQARLVALLFCRPELALMKSDIVPSLPYFHRRSGNNTAFYFAGFYEFIPVDKERQNGPYEFDGPNGTHWLFDAEQFNHLREQVEKSTRWRYSGGCDMLLVNSRRTGGLDFTTAVVLRLDKIGELIATPTIGQLFEAIFQYAERQDDINPTWGLSDFLGIKTAKSGLWDVIIGLLPEPFRNSIRASRNLVVQNIAPEAAQA